jgi:transposase
MSGIPEATAVILTAEERNELQSLARSTKTEHRLRQRARIVLLAADGTASRAIGRAVGCTTGTASKWRVRYAQRRLAGLDETGNRGAAPKYTAQTGKRILALLDQPPPPGYGRWSGPLLAAALGDVDVQYVWRFLRAQKIDLAGRKSWCESNDPEFVAKAADVVGLYMAPLENAIVICVDEKPSIQALERAQGYLKLPNGRALSGHSHDYKRNGTSTLFAAFEVATGKVTAAHKKRRRRVEFLDFMNEIVAVWPDTAIHVVLDNLNTHKPKHDRWLKRHPNAVRLYPDTGVLAQPGGNLVLDPARTVAARHILRLGQTTQRAHRCLHRGLQYRRQAVRLDQVRGSSKTPQSPFHASMIPGTRLLKKSLCGAFELRFCV